MRAANALPLLVLPILLSGCAGTTITEQLRPPGPPAPDSGVVVGSFLLESPEEGMLRDDYWVAIAKPGSFDSFTVPLHPFQEAEVVTELAAGTYLIQAIYQGKPGLVSRGHGAKGDLGFWFEVPAGEVSYIGRFRIIAAHRPDAVHEAIEEVTSQVLSAVFDADLPGNQRLRLYTGVTVEDDYDWAVELLRREGWSEAEVTGLTRSIITDENPGG